METKLYEPMIIESESYFKYDMEQDFIMVDKDKCNIIKKLIEDKAKVEHKLQTISKKYEQVSYDLTNTKQKISNLEQDYQRVLLLAKKYKKELDTIRVQYEQEQIEKRIKKAQEPLFY